ncbi:ras GEF [Dentipellis sp. KUC8613]|nr:ras GEF [Dentipellis sp. KUC8613]
MAAVVYGASSQHSSSSAVSAQIDGQQYIATFFCRALYDYQSADDSSLSFRRGDIIEVLTRLETGWWDGLLGEERGWFPSNYVVVISDDEADAAFSAVEFQQEAPSRPTEHATPAENPQSSSVSSSMASSSTMATSLTSSLSPSPADHRNWLEEDTDYEGSRGHLDGLASTSRDNPLQSNDFWVPQVTQDGQIFYVNTQTGQQSRDLPMEAEHDLSEDDFGSINNSQRMLGPGSSAPYRQSGQMRQSDSSPAGFGPPKRTGTPEPWVRRLADDGMSYFYWNKLDGSVQWTLPDSTQHRLNGNARVPSQLTSDQNQNFVDAAQKREAETVLQRIRSDSSVSNVPRNRSDSVAGYASAYSDDSDVDPLDRLASSSFKRNQPFSNMRFPDTNHIDNQILPHSDLEDSIQLTASEKLARALQQALAPLPPESVNDLSSIGRQAVSSVMDYIQANGVPARADEQEELENRLHSTVVSIRNLLCISSPPYGHVSSSLYPKDGPNPRANAFSQSLQAQLKPAQRKVTATLSKLVLATLAANYDANMSSDASSRMEQDAAELDRALLTFVLEVQRSNSQAAMQLTRVAQSSKRLWAAFLPISVGLGLVGSGAAGTWTGFGWIARLEAEKLPERDLSVDVLADARSLLSLLSEKCNTFQSLLGETVSALDVQANAQTIIAGMQSFVSLVTDINLARKVDVDGLSQNGQPPAQDAYMSSVQEARLLVRTLEVTLQAVYSDGALLLLTAQGFDHLQDDARKLKISVLDTSISSLKSNMTAVHQNLESLHLVAKGQAEMGQSDYTGAIEWRMSRIMNLDNSIGQQLAAMDSIADQPYDGEAEDVVDMELAFRTPAAVKANNIVDRSQSSSTLYSNPSQTSDSSIDMPTTRPRGSSNATTPSWAQHQASTSATSLISPDSGPADDYASVLQDDDDEAVLAAAKSPSRADKLIRVLGDAPGHIIDKMNAETKPWYLRPNYSLTEIIIDPDRKVRAGTVPALVERLTAHEQSDTTFTKTFLLTYKSFTDLDTLFNLLVQRFWIKPPDNLSSQELEEWTKLKQHIIRTRVLNTFKTMMLDDDILEKEDLYILDRMKQFISNEEVMHLAAAKQLLVLIERAQKGDTLKAKTTISLDAQPPPIVPRPSKKHKLLDFDPLEVARQLTMIECQLYQKIRASECLMRSREQKPGENNDNIAAIIETTNKIAHWVADTVLSKEDSRKRAAIVKQFVLVADRCRNLHNFSSMIAIVSGLNSPPIRRLKRTWEQINQRYMTQLGACEMTIDSNKNFNNYRSLLARITPPCVPFIGVYLTTLTFIQDGAPNTVSGDLVNFRKRQKAAEVIDEIKKWQSKPFNFTKVDVIHDYIQENLNKFNTIPDVSDLFWNLSLEREPREREDEKMARLLQETGFL